VALSNREQSQFLALPANAGNFENFKSEPSSICNTVKKQTERRQPRFRATPVVFKTVVQRTIRRTAGGFEAADYTPGIAAAVKEKGMAIPNCPMTKRV
jgi:hypothetical protein